MEYLAIFLSRGIPTHFVVFLSFTAGQWGDLHEYITAQRSLVQVLMWLLIDVGMQTYYLTLLLLVHIRLNQLPAAKRMSLSSGLQDVKCA